MFDFLKGDSNLSIYDNSLMALFFSFKEKKPKY